MVALGVAGWWQPRSEAKLWWFGPSPGLYVSSTAYGIRTAGWDWLWIGLGVVVDIMKWGQIANNRRQVPGYPESAY